MTTPDRWLREALERMAAENRDATYESYECDGFTEGHYKGPIPPEDLKKILAIMAGAHEIPSPLTGAGSVISDYVLSLLRTEALQLVMETKEFDLALGSYRDSLDDFLQDGGDVRSDYARGVVHRMLAVILASGLIRMDYLYMVYSAYRMGYMTAQTERKSRDQKPEATSGD